MNSKLENNYLQKYIKYKTKYNKLKNMKGGGENNILVVSHNGRIRCLIESLAKQTPESNLNKLINNNKGKEIRFKNCAILKVTVDSTKDDASIEMVYEGSIDKRKEGVYFGNDSAFINKDPNYIDEPFPLFTFKKNLLGLNGIDSNNVNNIYIMRHGEATHNASTLINVFWDTDLTKNGIDQTIKAGNEFLKNDKTKDIKFNLLCASILRRSRNTLNIFMNIVDRDNKSVIYILPCNHELKYYTENCDKTNDSAGHFYAPENRSNCDIDKDGNYINALINPTRSKDYLCQEVGNHKIDWRLNQEFYNRKKKCEDTNFIKILLQNYDILIDNKSQTEYQF